MPQFYFDTSGSTTVVQDVAGLAFVSLSDARAHAMTLLPVVGVELPMAEGEYRSWKIVVRDDADCVVCRLIMAVINDPLDPAGDRMLRPINPKP